MIYRTPNEQRSEVFSILQKLSIQSESRYLLVGDYAVGEFDSSGVLDGVLVERKDSDDYVGSLISGHLANQLYELSFNSSLSYLAIIGDMRTSFLDRQIPWNTFISSLVGDSYKRAPDGQQGQVIPIQLNDNWDFCNFLRYLNEKWVKGEQRIPSLIKRSWSDEEYILHIVSTFPNIGSKTAEQLLARFPSIRHIVNASIEELDSVPGIGRKKAESIHNLSNKEWKKLIVQNL